MDALVFSNDQNRVILAVVEPGGFSAAARRLSRVQPAV
ncbi:LysR family transcriptional regulator [Bosea sp. RAF48]